MAGGAQADFPGGQASAGKRAFTLAEVVVGVLLFGLAATVLTQAVSNGLNAYRLSQSGDSLDYPMHRVRDHVLSLATRDQLEEGGEIEVPVAVRDGEGGSDRTEVIRARWEAEAFPTKILDFFVVELKATMEAGGNDASVREESYMVYRPGWSESEEEERLLEVKEEEFEDRLSARGIVEEEEEEQP